MGTGSTFLEGCDSERHLSKEIKVLSLVGFWCQVRERGLIWLANQEHNPTIDLWSLKGEIVRVEGKDYLVTHLELDGPLQGDVGLRVTKEMR